MKQARVVGALYGTSRLSCIGLAVAVGVACASAPARAQQPVSNPAAADSALKNMQSAMRSMLDQQVARAGTIAEATEIGRMAALAKPETAQTLGRVVRYSPDA